MSCWSLFIFVPIFHRLRKKNKDNGLCIIFFFFYGFREIINGVLLFPICVLLYLSSLVLFVFSLFFYVLTFFSMRCENKIKWFVHMCLGFQGRFLVSFFFLMKCFALFFFVRSGFSNIRFYFPFGKKIKKNGLYIIFIG